MQLHVEMTPKRTEIMDELLKAPDYAKKSKSEIVEIALEEMAKRHARSKNPQTTLEMGGFKAIPNLYEIEDNPQFWEKFYKMLDVDEFNELAKLIQKLISIHERRKRELENA